MASTCESGGESAPYLTRSEHAHTALRQPTAHRCLLSSPFTSTCPQGECRSQPGPWSPEPEEAITMKSDLSRLTARVSAATAAILSLPALAMLFTDQVNWTFTDFVLAGLLLAVVGIAIELAVRRTGSLLGAIGIAALGIAAVVFGEEDDAPGLVLLGLLLVASACALGIRRRARAR